MAVFSAISVSSTCSYGHARGASKCDITSAVHSYICTHKPVHLDNDFHGVPPSEAVLTMLAGSQTRPSSSPSPEFHPDAACAVIQLKSHTTQIHCNMADSNKI
ncbi:hypothetical protein EYF80_022215 [Liparis tanakae]|uniref:Uncharacterized protein n=1 Tax=Liparis tanakae TaxID=230148 RepID=A0A4Z2HRV9_9TELE|nr:hypothetical protein EYF80_022215 [Liparis tanakae]